MAQLSLSRQYPKLTVRPNPNCTNPNFTAIINSSPQHFSETSKKHSQCAPFWNMPVFCRRCIYDPDWLGWSEARRVEPLRRVGGDRGALPFDFVATPLRKLKKRRWQQLILTDVLLLLTRSFSWHFAGKAPRLWSIPLMPFWPIFFSFLF